MNITRLAMIMGTLAIAACGGGSNTAPANNAPAASNATASAAPTASSSGSRDLTIASWGGNSQEAQQKIYFKPFSEKLGKPVLDENYDGGYGVIQAKVQGGNPN